MLSAQHACNPGSQTPERLAFGVYEVPLLLDFGWFL
jgi:hypothetical protein